MNLSALTYDVVTSLPADQLALRLLHAMVEGEPETFFQNRAHVRIDLENGPWADLDGTSRHWAARCYEEAFAWLEQHGVVAPEPSQSSPGWFFITRRGRLLLGEGGLAHLRAAERLEVDLHPLIAERVRSEYMLGEFELAALLALREVDPSRKRACALRPMSGSS